MKKKIIGLFLILVFSILMMPVTQVGVILAQGQLTEEIFSAAEDISKFKESEHHTFFAEAHQLPSAAELLAIVETDEHIRSRQADDIQTPPPNL